MASERIQMYGKVVVAGDLVLVPVESGKAGRTEGR